MNPVLRFVFVCLTSTTLVTWPALGQELQSQPEKQAVPEATAPAPGPARQEAQPQPEKKASPEFQVGADKLWVDTGLDLKRGDRIQLTSSGKIKFADGRESGPEGLPRGWADLIRILPLSNSNRGTTIGKIGSSEAAHPFLIGPSRETRVMAPGRLFLGINRTGNDRVEGSFRIAVEINSAEPATAATDAKHPEITQEQLDGIPSRVSDAAGNLGDRVNFVIIGSEQSVKESLTAAGWVQANRNIQEAIFQGALATFSRQSYVQMPMSDLNLFGRVQDYGWAKADPLMVVASRHHFRIWKAPFTADGRTVWIGAGTHDIGFDRDQRNNSITHKIDPDTDKEREFIGESLRAVGAVAKTLYMTPAKPVTEAKTAHGATFRSDGRTLIIVLHPDEQKH